MIYYYGIKSITRSVLCSIFDYGMMIPLISEEDDYEYRAGGNIGGNRIVSGFDGVHWLLFQQKGR